MRPPQAGDVGARVAERPTRKAARWIALIGNPNTGKTTLFNALTGGRAQTGNYPGVTVDKRVGTLRPDADPTVRLLDLPGTYSLAARSPDEMVAVDVLLGRRSDTPRPEAVIVVVDAMNLERNLYLVSQVIEIGIPVVVALNMVDAAQQRAIQVDAEALGRGLGVPVVPTVGHRKQGVDELRQAALEALDAEGPKDLIPWPDAFRRAEGHLEAALRQRGLDGASTVERRRALLDVGGEAEHRLVTVGGDRIRDLLVEARRDLEAAGASAAGFESSVRYAWIGGVVAGCLERPHEETHSLSDRIDQVLTHRVFGTVILVLVLGAMFLSIFSWAAPLMDLIDGTVFGGLADTVDGLAFLGDGALKSLVIDGVIAGVGSVLVFLPQILILFAFVGILEACGYMARAAFLMDRLMGWCGLSGRSFIPMLSSFACAVPGILATRTIENRRDRIVTILVAPLMSCSARIPVYVILIAAFIPPFMVLGFLPLQGLVFAGMYFLGIAVAVLVAWLLKKTVLRSERPSFLVELPPYRFPDLLLVFRRMLDQGREFVVRAGTLIFAATILVWALSYFPDAEVADAEAAERIAAQEQALLQTKERLEVERARQEQAVLAAEGQSDALGARARAAYEAFLEAKASREQALDAELQQRTLEAETAAAGATLRASYLGRAGRFVGPVFEPIGWDWKVSVAVLASFPAREVLVSSLGVLYNLGPQVDAESEGLRHRLRDARWESGPKEGRRVFDLASALALMVFFALCAQCVSTLVVIRKETGRWGWAAFSFGYMTLFAYVGALLTALLIRGLGA